TYCSSLSSSAHPRALHSFPTRRSSDLGVLHTAPRRCALERVEVHAHQVDELGVLLLDRLQVRGVVAQGEQPGVQLGVERLDPARSEEHTSELQSLRHLVCRLLLEKKKK